MSAIPSEVSQIRADLLDAVAATLAPSRPKRRRHRVWIAGGVAFAVLALAGYTIASNWIGNGGFQDTYRAAQRQLRLPPGARWPERQIPKSTRVSTNEGAAVAVTIAWTEWACYWSSAIQRNDETAATDSAHATASLLKNNFIQAPAGSSEDFVLSTDHPVAVLASDGGLRLLRQEYRAGLAGNAKPLQQDCTANRP